VRAEPPDIATRPSQARGAQAFTPTGFAPLASLSPKGEGPNSTPLPAAASSCHDAAGSGPAADARTDALIADAADHLAAGETETAVPLLQEALTRAEAGGDHGRRALALSTLSDAWLRLRRPDPALDFAGRGLVSARRCGNPEITATALNHLGNAAAALQRHGEAIRAYREGIGLLQDSRDDALTLSLTVNLLHALDATSAVEPALPLLQSAVARTAALQPPAARVPRLLALGHLALRLAAAPAPSRGAFTQLAAELLERARSIAGDGNDARSSSHAEGLLAQLDRAGGQLPGAEAHLRRALFFADQADAPELSARWHSFLGELREAGHDRAAAKAAYRQALEDLQPIRSALMFGYRGAPGTYREAVHTAYQRLTALLLAEASGAAAAAARQDSLEQLREVLEGFRGAELQNHFQDECVTALQERLQAGRREGLVEAGTAVLYPVALDDRLLLLLLFSDGRLQHVEVPVAAAALRDLLAAFRHELHGNGNPRRVRVLGHELYRYLIEPIRASLDARRIDTLVVAPDETLRSLPFAAIHDGRDFLLSRYAFAITPGLTLTEPAAGSPAAQLALFGGLTENRQGFAGLPYVDRELGAEERLYDGAHLVNQRFVKERVQAELERTPYGIVSFATHAKIAADPRQSFLLTYDDRISLDELQRFVRISRFRKEPVDLLVLSACDTAQGDERAALGLAGVAVKAGARSVMASLWAVNDASTSELVPLFLEHLKDAGLSKAQALRKAQLHLLQDPAYRHPYYWAPFVIIGNWR